MYLRWKFRHLWYPMCNELTNRRLHIIFYYSFAICNPSYNASPCATNEYVNITTILHNLTKVCFASISGINYN